MEPYKKQNKGKNRHGHGYGSADRAEPFKWMMPSLSCLSLQLWSVHQIAVVRLAYHQTVKQTRTNNSSNNSHGILINNAAGGYGLDIRNGTTASYGIYIDNDSVAAGLAVKNDGAGPAIYVNHTVSGQFLIELEYNTSNKFTVDTSGDAIFINIG